MSPTLLFKQKEEKVTFFATQKLPSPQYKSNQDLKNYIIVC